MIRRFVVVPAAGGGTRFGGDVPKQYADLGGAPVLARTLARLAALEPALIVVALAPDDARYDVAIGARPGVLAMRCGGATRADTVRNALAALESRAGRDDWIAVHDAARPCVPVGALARLVHELADDPVGGLLALPVADTLKRAADADGADFGAHRVLRTEDRAGLWQAQTPQMFRHRLLGAALAQGSAWTDEAQAIEALSATGACPMPRLVRGDPANLKITFAADLALARAVFAAQETPR